MDALTETQRKVFDFVTAELARGRPAPTAREIAARFRYRSHRAAEDHLKVLIRKGWLVSAPGKARSLRPARDHSDPDAVWRRAVVEIPFLGVIPAGFSRDAEAESGECIPVAVESVGFKPTRYTFALRVVGDSMIGKHICDGDVVLLEHGAEPRNGEVVAAFIDRKNTLKTFVLKNGRPFLKAENPKYPDLIPSEELVIQGVFRALIRTQKTSS
jgi:repressor LexA